MCMARCLRPININGQQFNCGNCLNCRINYTSQWQLRCLYELNSWNGAMFVTLTYDRMHLPANKSLSRKDLQDFFKRLRRNMQFDEFNTLYNGDYLVNPRNDKLYKPLIRYYACGEYGDDRKRPHYHIILYGLDYYNDEHWQYIIKSWGKCDPLVYDKNLGRHCAIQNVTRDDIGYVTGYVRKKLKGEMAKTEYDDTGRIRPFSAISHEIGLNLARKQSSLLVKGYTYQHNGRKIGVPRYFREKLGLPKVEKINYKSKEVVQAELDYLDKAFKTRYPQYAEVTENNVDTVCRLFERFVSSNEWTISQVVERDFMQRNKLRGDEL